MMWTLVRRFLGQLHRLDRIALMAFAAYASLYSVSVWAGTTPYARLTGDAANIATFAAGRAHPELFAGDPVLANSSNYRFYATIHIPVLLVLGKLTGSYGTSTLLLLPVHVWLQLAGFYLLGRVFFQSWLWALALTVVTSVTLILPLGEIWGLWPDALPRVTFQALLPFLLAAAYVWRAQVKAWPWLMMAAGALTYVHPVSAPGWAAAIWLGFGPFLPSNWPMKKRAAWLALMGLTCLAVALPFAWLYMSSYEHGVKPPEIVAMWSREVYVSFRDAPGATADFASTLWNLGLLPSALVAAVVVWRATKPDRSGVALLGCWTVGLLAVSTVVPTIDQAVARAHRGLPLEVDLIRGLRYLVPLLLIACVWAFALLARRPDRLRWAACLALPLGLAWIDQGDEGLMRRLASWDERRRAGVQLTEALGALRRLTPAGALILPRAEGLAVRYEALRPVLFTEKDANVLLYANQRDLPAFLARRERVRGLRALNSPARELRAWIALGAEWGADYLLLDFPAVQEQIPPEQALRVWGNESYSLLKLVSCYRS